MGNSTLRLDRHERTTRLQINSFISSSFFIITRMIYLCDINRKMSKFVNISISFNPVINFV